MNKRPIIKLKLTAFDYILEVAGWGILIFLISFSIYCYNIFPETIPIHYNAWGQVDRLGSKSMILLLPLIALLIFIVMTAISQYPQSMNYPVEITAENAETKYRLATRMLSYMRIAIVCTFLIIVYQTYKIVLGYSNDLESWSLPVILFLMLGPTLIFVVISSRKN
jgi:uncharacterized membrane protein